jgi:serine protease Do
MSTNRGNTPSSASRHRATPALPLGLILAALTGGQAFGDFPETCRKVWPRVVKIFGAGGIQRLHSYSSGILVSPKGHILTVWNHVLETDQLKVVLSDGQRFDARLQLVDTTLDAAVVKIEAEEFPCFDLEKSRIAKPGEWVLGFSNAYRVATGKEKPTVIHGILSAVTDLHARRGVFESPYNGPVYLVDGLMNNPGAGGGALTDSKGELLGMIGKELLSKETNTWLNYAIPPDVLAPFVRRALAGESTIPTGPAVSRPEEEKGASGKHGIVLVPDVLRHTPCYVDSVRPSSPAAKAGLAPDDLILFIEEDFVGTCRNFRKFMSKYRPGDTVNVLVKRGKEIVSFKLALE